MAEAISVTIAHVDHKEIQTIFTEEIIDWKRIEPKYDKESKPTFNKYKKMTFKKLNSNKALISALDLIRRFVLLKNSK